MHLVLRHAVLTSTRPAVATFTDSADITTNGTSFSFATRAIGTASHDRFVVVGVMGRDGSTGVVNSVTIGGVTAAVIVAGAIDTRAEFWGALVPTGTTATIDVVWSSLQVRCAIAVWALTSLKSTTATATSSSIASPPSTTINVAANGVLLAFASSVANTTGTWTGPTERSDAVSEAAQCYTAASLAYETQQTGLTVTATFLSHAQPAMVVAAFR